ncbi:TlpA family protein disulfide reductase [Zunongwangia sp.]|uniref:TlpA family protein disulfide reductase n=1 Tax=Zunongwangia sp. TaxID=1965325 RepID=UPI003AA97FC4
MNKKSKKRWSNVIWLVLIFLLILPQTRKPIAIYFNKLIAFSPSAIEKEKQDKLTSYNWILKDAEGSKVNFQKFKNKVIVLNFWATWCPPCIAEMPSYQQVVNKYKDEVVFLFVTNEDLKISTQFMKANNYTLPVYKPMTQYKELEHSQLPTSFVIDRKGNIVIKEVGAADWNSEKFHQVLERLIID